MQGRKSKIVDSIKLQVTAKMEDVTVKLENDVREITALEVSTKFAHLFAPWLFLNIPNFYNDICISFPSPFSHAHRFEI